MRIVTWNMNHCQRSESSRARAWAYLRDGLRADVALVQEAQPPPGLAQCVYQPINAANPRYNWGSAIVVFNPELTLRARPRIAVSKFPQGDEVHDSHPGTTAIADIVDTAGEVRMTAVSLYGQWAYMPDGECFAAPTLHRIFSDLSSLLLRADRPRVFVAGDFNATTQIAADGPWSKVEIAEAQLAFSRASVLGLRDVMAHTRASRPALEQCSCAEPKPCAHVRTYRNGNRTESRPTQLDYVFASQPVLAELSSCVVVDDVAAWALSDHCPVVVDFNTSASLAPIHGDADAVLGPADEAVIDDSELDEMKRWHMARMARLLNGEPN